MTDERTQEITRNRLAEWAKQMEQWHCTPAMLLTVGHDNRSGEVHVFICENLTDEMLESFLATLTTAIASMMRKQDRTGPWLPSMHT